MFAIGTVGQAAAIWIVCGGVRTVGGWLDESWDDVKSDGRAAAMGRGAEDAARRLHRSARRGGRV